VPTFHWTRPQSNHRSTPANTLNRSTRDLRHSSSAQLVPRRRRRFRRRAGCASRMPSSERPPDRGSRTGASDPASWSSRPSGVGSLATRVAGSQRGAIRARRSPSPEQPARTRRRSERKVQKERFSGPRGPRTIHEK
jgi:hypothetical protein